MSNPYVQAARLGVMTGMRNASGITTLSHHLTKNPSRHLEGTLFGLLQTPQFAALTKLGAVGELIGDKLPFTPARIGVFPLLMRLMVGAMVGAAVVKAAGESATNGAVVGAASALVGAFVGYFVRKRAHETLHIPDLILAVVEDSVVVALGAAFVEPKAKG